MRLTRKIDALGDAALALLYPLVCADCGESSVEARADAPVCAACWARTQVFDGRETLCWKCGAPARAQVSEDSKESVRCRRCDAWEFTAARACGAYEGALRAAVLGLKREPHLGERVARLMRAARARAPLDRATRVVPVPLHPERERERGFNQAAILARALASGAGLPYDESSLVRTVHTERHRAGMDARGRRETVEKAFRVARPRLVEGENVLLIDDVFTTGATVSACAAALTSAGARAVYVLTLARA
jgi:ComF family protein